MPNKKRLQVEVSDRRSVIYDSLMKRLDIETYKSLLENALDLLEIVSREIEDGGRLFIKKEGSGDREIILACLTALTRK